MGNLFLQGPVLESIVTNFSADNLLDNLRHVCKEWRKYVRIEIQKRFGPDGRKNYSLDRCFCGRRGRNWCKGFKCQRYNLALKCHHHLLQLDRKRKFICKDCFYRSVTKRYYLTTEEEDVVKSISDVFTVENRKRKSFVSDVQTARNRFGAEIWDYFLAYPYPFFQ